MCAVFFFVGVVVGSSLQGNTNILGTLDVDQDICGLLISCAMY